MSAGASTNAAWRIVRTLGVWGVLGVSCVSAATVLAFTREITASGYVLRVSTTTTHLEVEPAEPVHWGARHDAGAEAPAVLK